LHNLGDVVPHLAVQLAGAVAQGERQIGIAGFLLANLLGLNEEVGSDDPVGLNLADIRRFHLAGAAPGGVAGGVVAAGAAGAGAAGGVAAGAEAGLVAEPGPAEGVATVDAGPTRPCGITPRNFLRRRAATSSFVTVSGFNC